MDLDDIQEEMNKCIADECDGTCEEFHTEDSTICWCPICGRLYIMPLHCGLCYDPKVPVRIKENESG